MGEATYGTEVDLWSAGCILAELLNVGPRIGGTAAILPGTGEPDQLSKIWALCGTPDDTNWPGWNKLPLAKSFIPSETMPRRVRQKFANVENFDEHAINLIDKLLTLNPKKRPTAKDAIRSAYFKSAPMPAQPEEMPQFQSVHEYQAKKIRAQEKAERARQRSREQHEERQGRKRLSSGPVAPPSADKRMVGDPSLAKPERHVPAPHVPPLPNVKHEYPPPPIMAASAPADVKPLPAHPGPGPVGGATAMDSMYGGSNLPPPRQPPPSEFYGGQGGGGGPPGRESDAPMFPPSGGDAYHNHNQQQQQQQHQQDWQQQQQQQQDWQHRQQQHGPQSQYQQQGDGWRGGAQTPPPPPTIPNSEHYRHGQPPRHGEFGGDSRPGPHSAQGDFQRRGGPNGNSYGMHGGMNRGGPWRGPGGHPGGSGFHPSRGGPPPNQMNHQYGSGDHGPGGPGAGGYDQRDMRGGYNRDYRGGGGRGSLNVGGYGGRRQPGPGPRGGRGGGRFSHYTDNEPGWANERR